MAVMAALISNKIWFLFIGLTVVVVVGSPTTDLLTEVINKLSFQIIGAWELIANGYLRDILCKLNENELDNHENHN